MLQRLRKAKENSESFRVHGSVGRLQQTIDLSGPCDVRLERHIEENEDTGLRARSEQAFRIECSKRLGAGIPTRASAHQHGALGRSVGSGIRFIESGTETELAWDEIADIEVRRLDRTYLGPVSLWKRSSDASSPSGLLTNTEFTVIIHSHDGRGIRLSSMFLRSVSDPRKLISQLRLRAGLR